MEGNEDPSTTVGAGEGELDGQLEKQKKLQMFGNVYKQRRHQRSQRRRNRPKIKEYSSVQTDFVPQNDPMDI